MKKIYPVLLVCIAILIIAACLWFIPNATTVDISFHGYVVSSDGEILETVDIHVNGPKNSYLFKEDQFALRVSTSSDEWSISTPASMGSARDPYIDVPYLSFFTHITSSDEQSGGGNFAVSLEDGYFIAGRNHDSTKFLIGSTSADTDPSVILEYFSEYIALYFSGT